MAQGIIALIPVILRGGIRGSGSTLDWEAELAGERQPTELVKETRLVVVDRTRPSVESTITKRKENQVNGEMLDGAGRGGTHVPCSSSVFCIAS